jgi:hypothetical protein
VRLREVTRKKKNEKRKREEQRMMLAESQRAQGKEMERNRRRLEQV